MCKHTLLRKKLVADEPGSHEYVFACAKCHHEVGEPWIENHRSNTPDFRELKTELPTSSELLVRAVPSMLLAASLMIGIFWTTANYR